MLVDGGEEIGLGGFLACGLRGEEAVFDVNGGESGSPGEGGGALGAQFGGGFAEGGIHIGEVDGDLLDGPMDVGELRVEVGFDAVGGGVVGDERGDVGGVGFLSGLRIADRGGGNWIAWSRNLGVSVVG